MDNTKKKAIVSRKVMTLFIVLIFAGTLVAVSAALEPTISSSTGEFRGVQALGTSPGGGVSGYNVVWDNGMNYNNMGSTQNDTTILLVSLIADDFIFTEKQTVRDVHWRGGYYGPAEDGDFDWEIIFYNDNGTGNQPGTVIASYYYLNAETHETYIGLVGSGICYDYSVDLPKPVEFAANTKYWISIQGIGDLPPQSGWAMHTDSILLHEAVFKSAYFGFPDWTNTSTVWGEPYDMCFQLTSGKTKAPLLTPIGLVALVAMLSAIAALTIRRKRQ
jgi:hypothetical protein